MGGKILKLRSEELLELGEARGEARGKAIGEARGEARGRIEAIQNMIKYNVPKEKIIQDYSDDEYEKALHSMPVKA